jgi:hypothetical protein
VARAGSHIRVSEVRVAVTVEEDATANVSGIVRIVVFGGKSPALKIAGVFGNVLGNVHSP